LTARPILLSLIFLIGLHINAQEGLHTTVTVHTERASPGYVLFSPMQSQNAYLIDNEGRLVNQWHSPYRMLAVYLRENGNLVTSVIRRTPHFEAGTTGRIEEYDWDGRLVYSLDFGTDDFYAHHDFAILPNGNLLLSVWERISFDELIALGMKPENLPQDDDVTHLLYDYLVEINPLTQAVMWEWHVRDYFIQDMDPALPNFAFPAARPDRININILRRPEQIDRTHFNAVDYNAELDQILVSVHAYSEVWIIDRRTGDLVYRWGNPQVYERGIAENRQLHRQHDAHWLENGNILIFNNGSPNRRPFSSVIEIVPPLEPNGHYRLFGDSAYEPLAPVWEYRAEAETEFFARNLSGAQRLPNGHTLITDGPSGRLFEVTAEGDVVWEFWNPLLLSTENNRRASIFKARRYLPDYPAFTDRDLQAGEVLPLHRVGQDR